jgi:hypothetical protein
MWSEQEHHGDYVEGVVPASSALLDGCTVLEKGVLECTLYFIAMMGIV